MAQTLAVIAGQEILTESSWFYCDNEASRCALLKGFGKDERLNRLISCTWQLASAINLSPAFDRVTSSANMSDEISRNDLRLAESKGWTLISLNWDEIYKELAAATKSLKAASIAAPNLRKHSWRRKDMAGVRDDMVGNVDSSNRAKLHPKRSASDMQQKESSEVSCSTN
eukprot:Skav223900  [mRNA]  locus=scaffold2113:67388:67897:+ [translate_table: standard]